jgi:hypothetical protein
MSSRNVNAAGAPAGLRAVRLLALLALALAALLTPCLALTDEEIVRKGQETLGRVHAILTNPGIPKKPPDQAALEADRSQLQQALKAKDLPRLNSLVARSIADIDRVTAGKLQTALDRYRQTIAPLKGLTQPALRDLVRAGWPKIDRLLAGESKVLSLQDPGAVQAATTAAEAVRAAAAAELKGSLGSLRNGALRLAKGNERLLADRVRPFRPACDEAERAVAGDDVTAMVKASVALLPQISEARSRIDEALALARGSWAAAETEARQIQERYPEDLPYTDSGRRLTEARAAGSVALEGAQVDGLREAVDRLTRLVRKAPEEVAAKRTALLAEREARVKTAGEALAELRDDLKPETSTALEKAAGLVRGLAPGASLKTMTAALGDLETALRAARSESSLALEPARETAARARACVADLEGRLRDLLPVETRASVERCLEEIPGEGVATSARQLKQSASNCLSRCQEAGQGVCHAVEEEVQLAAGLAQREGLDGGLRGSLNEAITHLRPGLEGGDCRGLDRVRLGEVRRDRARAQVALSLKDAFTSIYDGPEGLEKAIRALDQLPLPRDQRERSPLYLWSLAYFYYLKHQETAGDDRAGWLVKARDTFRKAGSTARAELAGAGLFPDDFVTAMAAPAVDGS